MTVACDMSVSVAVPIVGASGALRGVMGAEAAKEGEGPTAFVATTVKVYVVPGVRPVIVPETSGAATVKVTPSGLDVIL